MCDTVTLLGTIGFFLLMSWLVFKYMGDDSVPGSDDDEKEGDEK